MAALGERLRLPIRVVGLHDGDELAAALQDIACVVHMAGPFAYVAGKLERPVSLAIALRGLQSASQGTLRTAIRQVGKPVLCRRAGAVVALDDPSPRWIDFGSGEDPCVPISLGRRGYGISQHWRWEHYYLFPPHGPAAFDESRGTCVRAVASIRNWTTGIGGPCPPSSGRTESCGASRPANHNLGRRHRHCGQVIQSTIDHAGCLRFHREQRPGNRPADYFAAARTGVGYALPGLRRGFRTDSARMQSRKRRSRRRPCGSDPA